MGGSLFERVAPASSLHVATTFNAVGWMSALKDGRLKDDVYEDFVFPVFYRSLPELLPPTGENREPPTVHVAKAEARECRVPFNEEFGRSGDSQAWAQSYADFIRAFSEPVVTSALPTTPDRPQLVDELYGRMVKRFAADPERYEFHFISLGALPTRV